MAYFYSRDLQDFEEEDMGQSHTQETGAQPWANGHSDIDNHIEAGQDIRSGTAANTAPANDGDPQEGAEMFNAYSPSWAEIKELIPIPWNPMTIESYKISARARVLDAAREHNEMEAALGPVADAEEPTPDDIASITAVFEAPPLWKAKWMARAVRRRIITSRRLRADLPAIPESRTASQSFVDLLDFVTAMEENHAPAPGIAINHLWASSHFMYAMSGFCFPATHLRWDLRDAFINFAADFVKRQLRDELEESRRRAFQPWGPRPSQALLFACLDQRFGPASSRMPHFVSCDLRRVERDIVLDQRRLADYIIWARLLVYSGHRGPSPIENPTNSLFQTFVVNTAIEEYTKKVDGVQDGNHNGEESGFDAGTWKAVIGPKIRHLVAIIHNDFGDGTRPEDVLATIHRHMPMYG